MLDKHDGAASKIRRDMRLIPQPLIGGDGRRHSVFDTAHRIGADANHNAAAAENFAADIFRESLLIIVERQPVLQAQPKLAVRAADKGFKHIHWRLANKGSSEQIGGAVLDHGRRVKLLQIAALHHRDAVGKGIGLGLVMRDEYRRQAAFLDEVFNAPAQDGAQLRLELSHWLIQQVQVSSADQGAAKAGALLLASRD